MKVNTRLLQDFDPDPASLLVAAYQAHNTIQAKIKRERQSCRKDLARRILNVYRRLKVRAQKSAFLKTHQRLNEKLLTLDQLHQDFIQSSYRECLQLSFKVCEKFISETYLQNHEALEKRLEEALKKYVSQNTISISVHSSSAPSIQKYSLGNPPRLSVKLDDNLAPGDIAIQCKHGSVLIRWHEELLALEQSLLAAAPVQQSAFQK